MASFEQRLRAIEDRNTRVEIDKAWETSWTRRVSIAVLTYVVVLAYLFVIGAERPFLGAVVPMVGYLLSTLAMRVVRGRWTARQ